MSKTFKHADGKPFMALDDIGFSVRKGEILGLIGENGSGKSTLLKVLSGYMKPTSGRAVLAYAASGILDIGSGFHPDISGYENMVYHIKLSGKKKVDDWAQKIITFSELEDFIHDPVKKYSSGMFMRLALSINLILAYPILFIDEVFSTGDLAFQFKVKEYLLNNREKYTCIIATHDLHMIRSLTDRCLWLEKGKVKMDDVSGKVVEEYLVAQTSAMLAGKAYLNQGPAVELFKDETLSVDTIRIIQGQNMGVFYYDQKFTVEVGISVFSENKNIDFAVRVRDLNNAEIHIDSPLFRSSGHPVNEVGSYFISFTYPDALFAPGIYKLSLLVIGRGQLLWEHKDIVLFNLSYRQNTSSDFDSSVLPSYTRIPVNWTISKKG